MGNKITFLSLAVVCLDWRPAFSGTTTMNILLAARSDGWVECGSTLCREESEVCQDNRYCECRPYFEDQGLQKCFPCPGEGQLCSECCISDALTCYRGVCQRCAVDSNGNCISQESLFFLTAAQVALATAMVLGVISLSFLLYKTLRNRLRRNNPVLQSETRQSVASRVSLSSIQQRVVRRLRDRPPKYETRHNYEYQQRQTEGQNSQPAGAPVELVLHPSVPTGGPPPAYEGDTVSLAENPPPYTQDQPGETSDHHIQSSNSTDHNNPPGEVANSGDSRSLQGITNPVFEPDKGDPTTLTVQPPGSGGNNGRPKEECIDIPLVNDGDKTVYM